MANYTLAIWKEDQLIKEIQASFSNDDEIRDAVINYIDEQPEFVVEVKKRKKIIHKYSMELGSHNQIKLFDQI